MKPGAVDDRDVDVVGGRVREADGGRLDVRDVFGLVIGDGRSVGDRAAPADRAGVREHRFDQRRLAGVMRADECDIA